MHTVREVGLPILLERGVLCLQFLQWNDNAPHDAGKKYPVISLIAGTRKGALETGASTDNPLPFPKNHMNPFGICAYNS